MCKPQAISITTSEMPLVVKRKTSLTIRHRLTPAITCSTTTRTLEKVRLQNFSPTVSSLPLGFFWAAWSTPLSAHSLESRCLCRAWCSCGRRPSLIHRLLSAWPAASAPNRRLCPCVRWSGGCSCRYASFSCRCNVPFAWRYLVGVGGAVRCHRPLGWEPLPRPRRSSRHRAPRAPGPVPEHARRAAELAGSDESVVGL